MHARTARAKFNGEHELQHRKLLYVCLDHIQAIQSGKARVVQGTQQCGLVHKLGQRLNIVGKRLWVAGEQT